MAWRLRGFRSAAPLACDFARIPRRDAVDVRCQSAPPAVLKRIGITTVCFRDRFASTRGKNDGADAGGSGADAADRAEVHRRHAGPAQRRDLERAVRGPCRSTTASRSRRRRTAVGSRIINIQVDGSREPVRSGRGEASRTRSRTIKEWMDRAAAVGAPTLSRQHRRRSAAKAWDVNRTADSFRQLASYGKKIGVKILVENHIGYSADIDKVVAVAKAVNDPYLPRDFGLGQHAVELSPRRGSTGLSKLFPYLELVSAKELDFDEQNRHINYDVVPLIKATEASGYKGHLLDRVLREAAEGYGGGREGNDQGADREYRV